MKKLKKLAALLLAGAMAMLLLTACGGGNGEDKQAEEAVMQKINTNRGASTQSSTQSLENDKDLREIALKYLNSDIEASGNAFGHIFTGGVYPEGIGDPNAEFVTVTVTAKYKFDGTMLSTLLNMILGSGRVPTNINANEEGNWTKVGVVVKSDNSQKYVAVTVQVRNPEYKK